MITYKNWWEGRRSQANSVGSNLYVKGQLGHYNENLPVILMEVATVTSSILLDLGMQCVRIGLSLTKYKRFSYYSVHCELL